MISTRFLISFFGFEEVPRRKRRPRPADEPETAGNLIGLQIAIGEDTFAFGSPRMPRARRSETADLPDMFR